MGAAIGQILPLAVGVALSPVPIIAVALMLMSQRARLNGPLFVIGWLIGLAGIGSGDQAIAYVVFALIATVGVATPVMMFFALGDRSQRILAGLRGAKLIGDAIGGFSS